MRGIDGLGVAAEVLENPFNDRRRLDAGDDAAPRSLAAAARVFGTIRTRSGLAGANTP